MKVTNEEVVSLPKNEGEQALFSLSADPKRRKPILRPSLIRKEKGTLLDNLNGLSNSVAEMQNTSSSVGKDTKLISIPQTNASKIVDENGEPMVDSADGTKRLVQDTNLGAIYRDIVYFFPYLCISISYR